MFHVIFYFEAKQMGFRFDFVVAILHPGKGKHYTPSSTRKENKFLSATPL